MAGQPQIDIIIPALTSAEELDRCLSSLDSRISPLTPKNWIIVDDGGKEQVAEVAKFFALTRQHVTVIRNEKRLYLARSVNRGLAYAKGKYHVVCMTGVMLEDKGIFDKLLYPFMRDAKAILTVGDVRCDWNSFPPFRIDRTAEYSPDLWAISKEGYSLLGGLSTETEDWNSFTDLQVRAQGIANAWAIPSVRTMTTPYSWPKRMPSNEELDKRAVSSPTVIAQR